MEYTLKRKIDEDNKTLTTMDNHVYHEGDEISLDG